MASPTLMDKFNSVINKIPKKSYGKETILYLWKKCHDEQARVEHLCGDDVWESTFLKALEKLWGKFSKNKVIIVLI